MRTVMVTTVRSLEQGGNHSDDELRHTFRACQSVMLNAIAGDFDGGSALSPTLQRCSPHGPFYVGARHAQCEYSGCDEPYVACEHSTSADFVPPVGTCVTGTLHERCAGRANGFALHDGSWCHDDFRVHHCPRAPSQTFATLLTPVGAGNASTSSSRELLGFCGTMLYQTARVKLNAMAGISAVVALYFSVSGYYLMAVLTLMVLVGIVSRRDGRSQIPFRGAFHQFCYAWFCCPCAMSWLVRSERHLSAGHARSWSLLSPTGTNDNSVEVLAVHRERV